MFGLGWHVKGVFVDAGNTHVAVQANKDLKADENRSSDIGNKAEDKKDAYHEATSKLPSVPATACTLDAGGVRRISDRIDAGKRARQ